jgi:NDP-sugar pyrophosphorylase family protein
MFTQAIILAAGRGTRMGHLSKELPKPLLPNPENCMLGMQIDWLHRFNLDVSITVGYQKAKIIEFAEGYGITRFIDTEDKGNAACLYELSAKKQKSPVLIITCDNLLNIDLMEVYRDFLDVETAGMLIPVEASQSIPGDRIYTDGQIITEISQDNSSPIICSGLQVLDLEKARLTISQDMNFHNVWNEMICNRQLAVSKIFPTVWIALDTPKSLETLSNFKRHG